MTSSSQSLKGARGAIAALAAVFLAEMLGNTIFSIAMPTIVRDLNAPPVLLQWIMGIYPLVFGGLLLLCGALSDRFGRRTMMLAGLGLFGTASLAVLLVQTPFELIILRAIIAVAAAMTAPNAMALAFRLFDDDDRRVRSTTIIGNIGMVGLVAGPLVGGFLLGFAPWQALLLINVPIALFAWFGVYYGISKDQPESLHVRPIDWTGALLATSTMMLAIYSLSHVVESGISSWATLAPAILAAITGLGFVWREKHAPHPLLDLSLFKLPSVSGGVLSQLGLAIATMTMSYLTVVLFQFGWGWSAFHAALGNLPQVLTIIIAAPLTNRLIKKLGFGKSGLLGSTVILSALLIYAFSAGHGYAWVAAAMATMALGMRLVMVTSAIGILKALPKNRTSIGSSLSDTSKELGSGFGAAIAGIMIAGLSANIITSYDAGGSTIATYYSTVQYTCLVVLPIVAILILYGNRLIRKGLQP